MTANVLIAGAGIGGLTAALALHARGVDVTVIERTDLRPQGVGVNLLPHAVRELYELGLGDQLSRIAVAPAAIAYYDTDGAILFREPGGIDGGYGDPQYSVHRGRLQTLLLTALRDRLGTNVVHGNAELTGFDESDGCVRVRTSSGDFVAGALVGADGIHSFVRRHLHPGPDPLLWSGLRMFRGAVDGEPFLDGCTMSIVKGANGVDLVVYPIGDGQINWVVMLPEAQPGPLPGDARWNHPGERSEVLGYLEHWNLDWLDAADLVRRTEPVLEYPMVDRDALPWWGRGRVTLLGDAAHPMYPVGANGGSQAIVDASVLAEELSRDPVHGLCRYEDRRRPETAEVVEANREMHRAGATQRSDDLARVTAKYRTDTKADRSHAGPPTLSSPAPATGHGAFDDLAAGLRNEGHRVLSYTLTGLAERAHLVHGGVNLETHITDVLAALAAEPDADDLVLVGHSYGGMVITGVADRVPEKVDALVYLDAVVPRRRRIVLASRQRRATAVVSRCRRNRLRRPADVILRPARDGPSPRVVPPADKADQRPEQVPASRLVYALKWPGDSPLRPSFERVRDDPNWNVHELDGAHNLMRDNPDDLLRSLLDVAQGQS